MLIIVMLLFFRILFHNIKIDNLIQVCHFRITIRKFYRDVPPGISNPLVLNKFTAC